MRQANGAPDSSQGRRARRDYYLSINIPAEELGEGDCTDRLIDPSGRAPGIWFQPVPEGKQDEPRTTATP